MLNRHTKQVPRDRDHGTNKSSRRANVSVAFPPHHSNPYDLEPGIDFLRSLIEARVLKRLEEIFERVKGLETNKGQGTSIEDRAVRLPEVLRILGISKSSLYDRLNPKSALHDPDLPRPFKLGNSERSPSVWWHSSMVAYLTSRAQLHATRG